MQILERSMNISMNNLWSRRKMLGAAIAAGAMAVSARVGAQGTSAAVPLSGLQTFVPPGRKPGPKGQRVFLDYDQDEINWAYDQAPWAANAGEISRRNAQKSAATIARLGAPLRVAYGDKDIERMDIYKTSAAMAPVHIFIHGGAWRRGSAKDVAYMAETYVDAGCIFIALDFNNVVEVDGDLMVMADQVRRAIAWVRRNASSFGGNPERLYVSGTSSGAHLAGVALTTDWAGQFGLPMDTLKGGLCCSGMYDLYPVTLSARANYVKFTPAMVQALSSVRLAGLASTPSKRAAVVLMRCTPEASLKAAACSMRSLAKAGDCTTRLKVVISAYQKE
jgi:arylformamidase